MNGPCLCGAPDCFRCFPGNEGLMCEHGESFEDCEEEGCGPEDGMTAAERREDDEARWEDYAEKEAQRWD